MGREPRALPAPVLRSVGPYIAAELVVEIPYVLAQSVIYSLLVYW